MAQSDGVLHAWIKVLLFQVGLKEKDLLYVLRLKGFNISLGC